MAHSEGGSSGPCFAEGELFIIVGPMLTEESGLTAWHDPEAKQLYLGAFDDHNHRYKS